MTHFRCLRCQETFAFAARKAGGYCPSCDANSKKEKMTMTNAELQRYRYRPQRMTILEELQKYIREEKPEALEPEKISNREFAPPDLLPFVRD